MKLGLGYISNSSSSSFVVAFKKAAMSKPCEHCGRKDPDFLDILQNKIDYDSYNTSIAARGYADVVKEIQENWFDSEKKNGHLEELKKYKSKEWETAVIELSYHDATIHKLKNNLVESGAMVIVWNSEED